LSSNEAYHILLTPTYRNWIRAPSVFSIPRNDNEEHRVGVVHRDIAWSGSLKNPLFVEKLCRILPQNSGMM
jgi:hypothetical protein